MFIELDRRNSGGPYYPLPERENKMAYYGDPKQELLASQQTKTWEANRARFDVEQTKEKLKISIVEFKEFVTKLVLNKKGVLPDVRDWKEIKKQLDKVEVLETELNNKIERSEHVQARLNEINSFVYEQEAQASVRPSQYAAQYENGFFHTEAYNTHFTVLPKAESTFAPPRKSALSIDNKTGHVRGFNERMIRNDHGKVIM